jgi:transcriptional regulator with XRE-family HTH domain
MERQMKLVALRAGKPQSWLSDRLRGRSPIYADDLLLLAQGLGRDPCDFFRDDDADGGTSPEPISISPLIRTSDWVAAAFLQIAEERMATLPLPEHDRETVRQLVGTLAHVLSKTS